MFEGVEFERKNMKDDEELEMLLDEIPHATSHNLHQHLHQKHNNHHHHHNVHGGGHVHRPFVTQTINGMYDDDPSSHCKYPCVSSPVSGFSLQSDGSSSSLFSCCHSLSDNGSPTPPSLEELKSHMPCGTSIYPNGLWLDSKLPVSPIRKKSNESLIDELGLSRNLSKMYISNEQEDSSSFKELLVDRERIRVGDGSLGGNNRFNFDKQGGCEKVRRAFSDFVGFQCPVERTGTGFEGEMNSAMLGLRPECKTGNFSGSQFSPGERYALYSGLNCCSNSVSSPRQKTKEQTSNYYQRGSPVSSIATPLSGLSMADALLYAQRNGMNSIEERVVLNFPNSPQVTCPRPHQFSVENFMYGLPQTNGRSRVPSLGIPQGGPEAFTAEDSFIIQGEGLNYMVNKGLDRPRGQNKGNLHDIGVGKHLERSLVDARRQIIGLCENSRNSRQYFQFSLPPKYSSLAEAQGYIYLIAKDQHGCRFLQRMLDEGTPQDVQIIFSEIIDHVVELMMNPFGNYLMQKLLDVCNEEQRMQILIMVTAEPGELVRISLNTHGTRVVQKLIETLKTRQQISLVISALEPGFLALIKDLNGNHVVQRCLQCLSNEDNKFIFVAAAKYCVDIATHQHGCCVLQRCISHSTGEHRENLVAEISANGLLLAQDAYGNYVVQFILELKIPSATTNLVSQFEGNYLHLSTQKFSSHVVEKCLLVLKDEHRSRIIHELLSSSHFEQLLQDPHANYVIQTALRVSEGPMHNLLVEAIESHKAISRNSPYSKRIFSQKLLKK
ncbi:uncharacterized protein LOC107421499 [Ziziphus jujuba]|uniref:Uncharacterized protein LOC107421499 n=1 Tax=Ziziphus jujuba TaxID=326968 RepID=A0A6P4ADD6_ZIZJJ|nr:uncharacterized protein LOC107421499 [Ziziphus jujuba]